MSTDPTRPMPQQGGSPQYSPDQTPTVRYPAQAQAQAQAHVPVRSAAPDAGLRARQRVEDQQYARKRRRHPVRRSVIAGFTVLVVLLLLVVGDRVANAVAENTIADKIQSSGFPAKPAVTITGFPFLTQVAAHDIHQIDISASNVPAGPVELSSVTATATGVHLNSSFNGGTVDQINGNLLVTFAALAGAGTNGAGAGVTISAAGTNKIQISAAGVPLGEAEVMLTGSNQVSVKPVSTGGILGGILSVIGSNVSFNAFSFPIPKLPAGLRVTSVSVTSQGLRIAASAHDTQLSQ